jgi:hypothetical protein
MKLIAFILILVCCLWTSLEAGEIYKWIDESGVKYFSNEPPPRGVKRVNATNEIPYDKASDQKRSREEIEALKKDLQQQEASTSQAALTESSNSRDSDAGVIVDPEWPATGRRAQAGSAQRKQAREA